jgi:hypothetical protein
MVVDALSELVGEFYQSVGTTNGFHKVPPIGIIDRLLGEYWIRADFKDPETTISSEIRQWRNALAKDKFLGSISIRHSGLVVYDALVNRNDHTDHANRQFSMEEAWRGALKELTARYQSEQ